MKYEKTAKRLVMALNRKGMIAQELSDRTGIHKSSISQYVNGSHAPSNFSAGKMGEVLDVNPVWLMGYDVPMLPLQKLPGEMGVNAERISAYLQELESIAINMSEKYLKKVVDYAEGLYAIQKAEEELK